MNFYLVYLTNIVFVQTKQERSRVMYDLIILDWEGIVVSHFPTFILKGRHDLILSRHHIIITQTEVCRLFLASLM